MEKYLTLGQVIDLIELDEVALRVGGSDFKIPTGKGFTYASTDGVQLVKETDEIASLKALSGEPIHIGKDLTGKLEKGKYIIIKREVYEKIKGGK